MGLSGMKGRVHISSPGCPNSGDSGSASEIGDEITKFVTTESVTSRKYGSSKSSGAQKVCSGLWSMEITIEAVAGPEASPTMPYAGQKVYLELYPYGEECGTPATGWALLERCTVTSDQNNGEPVTYVASLASDGPWSITPSMDEMGGFECGCGSNGGGGSGGGGSEGLDELSGDLVAV